MNRFAGKTNMIIISLLVSLCLNGCTSSGNGDTSAQKGGTALNTDTRLETQANEEKEKNQQQQGNMIEDLAFEGGAMVFNAIQGASRINGKLDFGREIDGKITKWIITQWNSRSDLAKIEGKREGSAYVYRNDYKTVSLDDDGTITLGVNGGMEYDKPRARSSDPWLHLYLEQRFKKPKPLLGDDLNVQFDMRITEAVTQMAEADINPDIHATIAVFYLILMDLNGSGQYINFCVPLYDNRHDIPPGGAHLDVVGPVSGLTNQLIYEMDGKKIYDAPTGNGEWHHVDVDLKPYIEEALNIAQQNNFLVGRTFADLGLSSMFVGWEVPGIFKNELQINNIVVSQK